MTGLVVLAAWLIWPGSLTYVLFGFILSFIVVSRRLFGFAGQVTDELWQLEQSETTSISLLTTAIKRVALGQTAQAKSRLTSNRAVESHVPCRNERQATIRRQCRLRTGLGKW
jgi:hypothetical protein